MAGAFAPCGTGTVSILLALIVHFIAVILHDSALQNVAITNQSTSQNIKSGLIPCSQILRLIDDS